MRKESTVAAQVEGNAVPRHAAAAPMAQNRDAIRRFMVKSPSSIWERVLGTLPVTGVPANGRSRGCRAVMPVDAFAPPVASTSPPGKDPHLHRDLGPSGLQW